jgi:hypothetical protein
VAHPLTVALPRLLPERSVVLEQLQERLAILARTTIQVILAGTEETVPIPEPLPKLDSTTQPFAAIAKEISKTHFP